MSTYCIENIYIYIDSNIKLIHFENKSKRLDLLEQLEIKKFLSNQKVITTNDQQKFLNTPIIDKYISSINPGFTLH